MRGKLIDVSLHCHALRDCLLDWCGQIRRPLLEVLGLVGQKFRLKLHNFFDTVGLDNFLRQNKHLIDVILGARKHLIFKILSISVFVRMAQICAAGTEAVSTI